MSNNFKHTCIRLAAAAVAGAFSLAAHAAKIEIVNGNEPGVGFNDATPVEPVGGNPGTTVGEQRLNVFKRAAEIWGEKLQSDVAIQVLAFIEPLACTANSAVLGSAGTANSFGNFPGAPRENTWYPHALANKLAKEDFSPGAVDINTGEGAEIFAFFNSELGKPGCLEGGGFYLGLDGNEPTGKQDFLTTVLHEIGHGLGFSVRPTSPSTGVRSQNLASAWEQFLYDNTQRKTWLDMTDEQRAASITNARQVAWNGLRVRSKARDVLQKGAPDLFVAGAGFNKFIQIGTAEFGPALTKDAIAAPVVPVTDTAGLTTACVALSAGSAAKVAGKVALIDRGGCSFSVKVKFAQDAGAKAVIVADNVAGSPPPNLGGVDATITIPSVRVTLDDGTALRNAATTASNPYAGPISVLFQNNLRLAGADLLGRPLLYTPNPAVSGSSVSHFDTSATPNVLMEPSITPSLSAAVSAPQDLTFELLRDIGW